MFKNSIGNPYQINRFNIFYISHIFLYTFTKNINKTARSKKWEVKGQRTWRNPFYSQCHYKKGMENMKREKTDFALLKKLFWAMFSLSACTFGGGFVIVSLMKKKVVEEHHWLEEDEMLDVTAIAQSSPGPIPVNASVILGYRLHGVLGSLVAVCGTILPPMVLLSLIAVFYDQFRNNQIINTALTVMRAGVAAVICDVVINLAKNVIATHKVLYIALMIITFIMAYFLSVSAMIIILCCLGTGIICVLINLCKIRKETI